jgi:hypothetical protein
MRLEYSLHHGKQVGGTHLFLLVPKTVDGKPDTALKLYELCAERKESGDSLIDSGGETDDWMSQSF